jgi:hypothetical protein
MHFFTGGISQWSTHPGGKIGNLMYPVATYYVPDDVKILYLFFPNFFTKRLRRSSRIGWLWRDTNCSRQT